MRIPLLIRNKRTALNTKCLIYKSLLKPIWTRRKNRDTNRIQAFQYVSLRRRPKARAIYFQRNCSKRFPHKTNRTRNTQLLHTIPQMVRKLI